MKQMRRDPEIFNKQLMSRTPKYEFDDESRAFRPYFGIGAQQEGSLMPMKPNLQGGSVLGQESYGDKVAKFADKEGYGCPFKDLADLLDTCTVSSIEKVEKMRPTLTDRESNSSLVLEKSTKAMYDLRSGRSNPSSVSRIIELQSLSLLSETQTAKVRFMCSFGGKLLPRITDGKLRYVGGESRIIAVNKDIVYVELRRKLMDVYGQPFVLKYQLPDDELDAFVSLSSDEDLEHMLEDYSRIEGGEGSSRLRIFLFSVDDDELAHYEAITDKKNSHQRYVDAVNGIMDAGVRKQSWKKNSSSTQQLDDMLILDVSEKQHGNSSTQESSEKSILPAGNVPFPSMQYISSDQVTLPPSSQLLSSLTTHFEPSGTTDSSMIVFQGKPLKVNGHSLTKVIQAENQNDVDYGGTISSPFQRSLESRVSDPNAKLIQVGSHAMLTQTQDEVGVSSSAFDCCFDVQTLNVDPHTIVIQHPPSSVSQLLWQHQSNVNHNSYIAMNNTQHQPFHQYPVSYLNGQQLLSSGVTGFGHIDQAWLHKKDMCNVHFIYGGSKYVVPQPSPLPNSHEKANGAEGLMEFRMVECDDSARTMQETQINDGHFPQLLGSNHAQIGQNYNAMGFPEVSDLGSGLYSYSESHRTKVYKSFEGLYAETPAILGQKHAGIRTGSSEASEFIPQLKGAATLTRHSSYGTENLLPTLDLSSFTDGNDAMQSNVLSHMAAKREKSISSSKEAALPISINDLHMQNILKSDTPESLQTFGVSEFAIDIQEDIPSLPVNDSVSSGSQSDQDTISTLTTTEDNLDDYFTIDLEGIAGSDAEAPSRPPPPLLLTFQTSSADDRSYVNDDVNKYNSNGRLSEEVAEEEHLIEEKTKVKGVDNGEPLSDAVIAEAKAILHGLQTIRNADLEELRELGSGTFGTVYHGRWRGSDIAIKRIKSSCFAGKPSEEDSLKADFWSEACTLSQLHHPNIVAFYGVVPDGPGGTLGTVTEFMVNGSLKQFLHRNERSIDHHKRIFIAMGAACGMEYLHRKRIVHFDLKCDNLLVNMKDPQRPICKVADFGLSKIKHQTLISGGVRGSLPWMAPELLNGNSIMVTDKVDVFSFGIVMWEILTEKEPYAELHCGAIIGGILNNVLRPTIPANCEPSWKSLMERCWSANPAARPSFSKIVDELQSMLASFYPKGRGLSSFNLSLSLKQF